MSSDEIHELQELLNALQERDNNAVSEINETFGGKTIEAQIDLANGRAIDALGAVAVLAKYIMKKERTEMTCLKEGDKVRVDFNGAQTTLCHEAEVLYIPQATGESWVFRDLRTQQIHFVSEGCTITLLEEQENRNEQE